MTRWVVVRVLSREVEADTASEAVLAERDDLEHWQVIGVQAKRLDAIRSEIVSDAETFDTGLLH